MKRSRSYHQFHWIQQCHLAALAAAGEPGEQLGVPVEAVEVAAAVSAHEASASGAASGTPVAAGRQTADCEL